MQEWLITILGTMNLGVLHSCTGYARGLHGGNSGLVMCAPSMGHTDSDHTDILAGGYLRV